MPRFPLFDRVLLLQTFQAANHSGPADARVTQLRDLHDLHDRELRHSRLPAELIRADGLTFIGEDLVHQIFVDLVRLANQPDETWQR